MSCSDFINKLHKKSMDWNGFCLFRPQGIKFYGLKSAWMTSEKGITDASLKLLQSFICEPVHLVELYNGCYQWEQKNTWFRTITINQLACSSGRVRLGELYKKSSSWMWQRSSPPIYRKVGGPTSNNNTLYWSCRCPWAIIDQGDLHREKVTERWDWVCGRFWTRMTQDWVQRSNHYASTTTHRSLVNGRSIRHSRGMPR